MGYRNVNEREREQLLRADRLIERHIDRPLGKRWEGGTAIFFHNVNNPFPPN